MVFLEAKKIRLLDKELLIIRARQGQLHCSTIFCKKSEWMQRIYEILAPHVGRLYKKGTFLTKNEIKGA